MSNSQAPNRVNGLRRKFSGLSAHPKYFRASSLFSPQAPPEPDPLGILAERIGLSSRGAPQQGCWGAWACDRPRPIPL